MKAMIAIIIFTIVKPGFHYIVTQSWNIAIDTDLGLLQKDLWSFLIVNGRTLSKT